MSPAEPNVCSCEFTSRFRQYCRRYLHINTRVHLAGPRCTTPLCSVLTCAQRAAALHLPFARVISVPIAVNSAHPACPPSCHYTLREILLRYSPSLRRRCIDTSSCLLISVPHLMTPLWLRYCVGARAPTHLMTHTPNMTHRTTVYTPCWRERVFRRAVLSIYIIHSHNPPINPLRGPLFGVSPL